MISVSITGTGPPLVVSPGSLATAEDWQFEFVRMPGDAIAALRQQPIWSRLATMTPSWTREVRAIDQFGGDLERFRAISVPVLLIVGEPARPGWPIFPAASRWSCLMRELAEIPGQAHDAHVFDAAAIGEKIAAFALQSARYRGKSNWATSSHVTEDGC